jgi:hypothetical protein
MVLNYPSQKMPEVFGLYPTGSSIDRPWMRLNIKEVKPLMQPEEHARMTKHHNLLRGWRYGNLTDEEKQLFIPDILRR